MVSRKKTRKQYTGLSVFGDCRMQYDHQDFPAGNRPIKRSFGKYAAKCNNENPNFFIMSCTLEYITHS